MKATIEVFKGTPVINLGKIGWKNFSFGVTKAKAILENLEEIKTFVEQNKVVEQSDTGPLPPLPEINF